MEVEDNVGGRQAFVIGDVPDVEEDSPGDGEDHGKQSSGAGMERH
jgi:hypothetical protein